MMSRSLTALTLALGLVASCSSGGSQATTGPGNPATPLPSISDVSLTELAPDGLLLEWASNVPTKSRLRWGLTPDLEDATTVSNQYVLRHEVELWGLEPEVPYYYSMECRDAEGHDAVPVTKTHAIADRIPPQMLDLAIEHKGAGTVKLTWSTDEPTTSEVEFGLTANLGLWQSTGGQPKTAHRALLRELTPMQEYTFQVRSRDRSGNEAVSPSSTFETRLPSHLPSVAASDPPPPPPVEGWTDFELPAGGRAIYVSSSEGDNSNDGLSEATPIASHRTGLNLLRDGRGDWLLLKRGDVFQGGFGQMHGKSGISPQQPLLIGAYGDVELPRPRIRAGIVGHGIEVGGQASYVAIVGLEFVSKDSMGNHGKRGVYWRGDGQYFLLEDCRVVGFTHNVTVLGSGSFRDVRLRRCSIEGSFNTDGQSQGLFVDEVDGLLVEECLLDHNGWSEKVLGAPGSVFNRNAYLTSKNTNVVWRRNISTNSSSDGLQMRAGGIVEESVFAANSTGFTFGLVRGGSTPVPGGVTGRVTDNLVLQSNDIEGGKKTLKRGTGIAVANIKSATIANNVIAHVNSEGDFGNAISLTGDIDGEVDSGIHDLLIEENFVYHWPQPIQIENGQPGKDLVDIEIRNNRIENPFPFTGGRGRLVRTNKSAPQEVRFSGNSYFTAEPPTNWFRIGSENHTLEEWAGKAKEQGWTKLPGPTAFPDPDRDLGTYVDELEDRKNSDLDDFVEEVSKQRRGYWREAYTARAVIDYVRAGFGLEPLD